MITNNRLIKASIIVPVYNSEEHLRDTVESILSQSFGDFEVILVDDGSRDMSGSICDEYMAVDHRVKVIHKDNGGVSSARNEGIRKALGEYITFCDSDDYLEPCYLDELLKVAENEPDTGHIWCCFQTVMGYKGEGAKVNCVLPDEICHFDLKDYMTLHKMWLDTGPCNKLYRTDVIRDGGIYFPEDISLGEDWLFNLSYIDASENGNFAVISKPLYNYVKGNNESLDSKYRPDLFDIYKRLNNECLSYLQKWNISDDGIADFYDSRFYLYERVLLNNMKAPVRSLLSRIRENDSFLKSEDFKGALAVRRCFVHPIYLKAYRSGRYLNVILADMAVKMKNGITRIFSK